MERLVPAPLCGVGGPNVALLGTNTMPLYPRLLSIGLVVLVLVLVLSPAALAWQPVLDPGPPVVDPATQAAIDELDDRIRRVDAERKEVQASADLSPEVKDAADKHYELALGRLEASKSHVRQAAHFRLQLTTAPREQDRIRSALDESPRPTADTSGGTTSSQLSAKATELDGAIVTLRNELTTVDQRIVELEQRPAKIPGELSTVDQKLTQLADEESEPPPEGQVSVVTAAVRVALDARRRARLAEKEELEQERLSHAVRLALEHERKRDIEHKIQHRSEVARLTRELADATLLAEARADTDQAERVKEAASGSHAVIREITAETLAWAQKYEDAARRSTATTERIRELKRAAERLGEEFERARDRIKAASLSEVVGRVLRRQRRSLPSKRDYRVATAAREDEISRVEVDLILIDDALRDLEDLESATERRVAGVEELRRAALAAELQPHLVDQKKGLETLKKAYSGYLDRLGDVDFEQNALIQKADEFAMFLDEHLVWIRSSKPIDRTTLPQLVEAVAWLFAPRNWLELAGTVVAVVTGSPARSAFFLLVLVSLLVTSRRLSRRLELVRSQVGKVQSDSILLTWQEFATEALRVLPLPLLLGYVCWQMRNERSGADFAAAMASGLSTLAIGLFGLRLFRRLLAEGGIAERHFRWRAETLGFLRRKTLSTILWFILLPAACVVSLMNAQGNEAFQNTLGRLSFIVFMVATLRVVWCLLHPSRGPAAPILRERPDAWLSRLRWVWFVLALGVPAALVSLALFGYYYTAEALGSERLLATLILIVLAVFVQNVFQRWVYVAHRRLAWEKAKEERKARLAAAQAGQVESSAGKAEDGESKDGDGRGDAQHAETGPGPDVAPEEPEVDLEEVRHQTRYLLGSLVGTCVILGLWLIWADVLPALGFLERVRLWEYEVTAGESSWITMKHVALAAVIGVITLVAGRNLPGALELGILQKLPIDAGARYAVTTLCQYVIVLIGFGVAFQAIGVGWAQIQWLVAAVGVGLGFGLQEIFANFVSGVILLFERPIRVGDIVTVGDVSGTVSRIRMRATTIINWERKELVVPNKTFITGQLLNWTLSDQVTRLLIEVGVAYGSDTERARRLLLDVAREHPLVVEHPAPRATFDAFGDSALNLTLRCFTSNVEARLETIHELHSAVDEKFRAAGIEIAFPQRDLHLRSVDASIPKLGPDPTGRD